MPETDITIVTGDAEAKEWLRTGSARVDDWLYELVDEITFYAADRLRMHAPGRIKMLVDVNIPVEHGPGVFEARAGVESEIIPQSTRRGLGSDPADFPVFVDQGTGLYGERHSRIFPVPGQVMGPILFNGRRIFIKSFEGQPAQHFSQHAFDDTVAWIPAKIEVAKSRLYASVEATDKV